MIISCENNGSLDKRNVILFFLFVVGSRHIHCICYVQTSNLVQGSVFVQLPAKI